MSIFYILSTYSIFHPAVIQNQVGDACIKTIEFQAKRLQLREKEMNKNNKKAAKGEIKEADIDKERVT